MFFLIGATMAGSIVLVSASPVPTFNVEPGCRAAAARVHAPGYVSVCRESEQKARDEIVRQWPQLKAVDKAQCVPLSKLGGKPTYTELLTCLEMAREARNLQSKTEPATTTGQNRK